MTGPRLSRRIADLAATRPPAGAPPAQVVAWLNRKADLHLTIAERCRALGDVPGAVEAEVLAHRAHRDADDLARRRELPVPDCRLINLGDYAADDRHTSAAGRAAEVDVHDTG